MSEYLFILGRQSALGRAELESVYGKNAVTPFGQQAMIVTGTITAEDFERYGGSIKLARIIRDFETTNWNLIQKQVLKTAPKQAALLPEGKLQLGMSTYGLPLKPQQLLASGLSLKKIIRATGGRSVRLVPNNELALNSAQVLHNNLVGPLGWELIFVSDGTSTIMAQTMAEQDIDSYTIRDRGRPKRDARVGMLPPKLAQILINISLGGHNPSNAVVLDPFCGTGVILQEAALMGSAVYGTDLEDRMVQFTDSNLAWLQETFNFNFKYGLEQGDATSHIWKPVPTAVASETYLGQPLTRLPDEQKLQTIAHTCNQIIKHFLHELHSQIPTGTRLCLAVPAWKRSESSFEHLPLVDQIEDLGYNRISFATASNEDLIYHRENQIVARELLVLTRK